MFRSGSVLSYQIVGVFHNVNYVPQQIRAVRVGAGHSNVVFSRYRVQVVSAGRKVQQSARVVQQQQCKTIATKKQ